MIKNILVTGANGFIGKNVCNLLSDESDFNIFKGTRQTIDLYSKVAVKEFVETKEIDVIIHCAVEGGHRTEIDNPDIVYKNILMAENLLASLNSHTLFINIATGAEFDRRNDINRCGNDVDHWESNPLMTEVPIDYYGLSKNIIAKSVLNHRNGINLRLFGCFYHNEPYHRFIMSNIERYAKGENMYIHGDKYMDFFYMEDLATVIKTYILVSPYKDYNCKDINLAYDKQYKLSDIANIINNLSEKKVGIDLHLYYKLNNYCGNPVKLYQLKEAVNLPLKGLETGIKECYNTFKINEH